MLKESYLDVKHLINEGDVILFRGNGFFSGLVRAYGQSAYTHVGLASWVNGSSNTTDGILELVEFREGSFLSGIFGSSGGGCGRAINLDREVKKFSGRVDVYRPCQNFGQFTYDKDTKNIEYISVPFDGKKVTRILRYMTGLPYGWHRVWTIIKYRILLFGLYNNYDSLMSDESKEDIYPVCSSVVAYAFSINGYDLIKNRSDEWTSPGDIASSPRLSYLFTLC